MRKLITRTLGVLLNITAPIFPSWNGKLGFKLLCRVRRVGISDRGKNFLSSAATEFLDIDGTSAVLHTWGNGPKAILFLHGWMSNSQRWEPYVNKIDLTKYTVYALDAPGHGMAKGNQLTIEMYRSAVALAIRRAKSFEAVVCHSLGSLVGAYAYLNDPKIAVKKFVIMGAPSGMDAIFDYFQNLLQLSSTTISNLDTVVNEILKVPHQQISMENFFYRVDRSVLVVHDQNDVITPYRPIEKALKQHKHIKTLVTKDLNHDLKSEAVYEAVLEFIQNDEAVKKQRFSA